MERGTPSREVEVEDARLEVAGGHRAPLDAHDPFRKQAPKGEHEHADGELGDGRHAADRPKLRDLAVDLARPNFRKSFLRGSHPQQ